MNLVTPYLKDSILEKLVERCKLSTITIINREKLANELSTTKEVIDGILHQFVNMGLCSTSNDSLCGNINIILNVEAHDMVSRGGFVAKEQILEDNLKKLSFEIKQLRAKDVEMAARISGIVANIATFFKIILQP